MHPFTQLRKAAGLLESIKVKPYTVSGGLLSGGMTGATLGGLGGGGIGLIKSLLDSEDDDAAATLKKTLKGGVIGAAGGGLLGAGYGATNRDEVRAALIEDMVDSYKKRIAPKPDFLGLGERIIRNRVGPALPELQVSLGDLMNAILEYKGRNIVYPSFPEKSASTEAPLKERLSDEEVQRRRKKLKLILGASLGGLQGAAMGAITGATSAGRSLEDRFNGRSNGKSALLRGLLGALIGGTGGAALGAGGAALSNKITDYADIDPLVPTFATERRR